MRCYWGMGVGHAYSHPADDDGAAMSMDPPTNETGEEAEDDIEMINVNGAGQGDTVENDDEDGNDSELGLEDREMEAQDSEESDGDLNDAESEDEKQDGENFGEYIEMYGEGFGL